MKIFVVSLRRSIERRAYISAHLLELGLTFEWIDAIDGSLLARDELKSVYNDRWARRHVGRSLKAGEIGCALSHIEAYRQIVARNIPAALILEDDAHLDPASIGWLKILEEWLIPQEASVVLLSEVANKALPSDRASACCDLMSVRSAAYLAHAYVVTQESARRLAALLFPIVQVADDWSWMSRNTAIVLYASAVTLACPFAAHGDRSTIGQRPSADSLVTGRLHRLRCAVHRRFWNSVDRHGLGYRYWRSK